MAWSKGCPSFLKAEEARFRAVANMATDLVEEGVFEFVHWWDSCDGVSLDERVGAAALQRRDATTVSSIPLTRWVRRIGGGPCGKFLPLNNERACREMQWKAGQGRIKQPRANLA